MLAALLRNESHVKVIRPETGHANHWLNLIRIDPDHRDDVLEGLNRNGIIAHASWSPLCHMKPYRQYPRYQIETATKLYQSIIYLPNGLLEN